MKKEIFNQILYHGTCQDSAENMVKNGWSPNSHGVGGNDGNPSFLYVTNEYDNAMWFAEEKGCNTVIELKEIPIDSMGVDPEDGIGSDVEEEVALRGNFPSYFIIKKKIPKDNIRISKKKINV